MTQQKKGFTIIEVVLVLAIAGLIFLMAFIALPALQRGQRNSQRRSDVGTMVSQLNSFATNNRGSLPSNVDGTAPDFTNFFSNYITGLNDPKNGTPYTVEPNTTAGDATLAVGRVQYKRGVQCAGESATGTGTARQAAVRVKLEGAGHFCQNVNG